MTGEMETMIRLGMIRVSLREWLGN